MVLPFLSSTASPSRPTPWNSFNVHSSSLYVDQGVLVIFSCFTSLARCVLCLKPWNGNSHSGLHSLFFFSSCFERETHSLATNTPKPRSLSSDHAVSLLRS